MAPPHANFLAEMREYLQKNSTLATNLSALMAAAFATAPSEKIKGIWRDGCVLSLSYTGLGSVGWFEKAVATAKMDHRTFLKNVAVETLGPFIRKYLDLCNVHASWPFCHIMDDTALSDLSALNIPAVTCFFVALSLNHMTFEDEL